MRGFNSDLVSHASGNIVDPATGSQGRIHRMIGWYRDDIPPVGEQVCCCRMEVEVIKSGRKAHHKEGDIVIWSIPFTTVMSRKELFGSMLASRTIDYLHKDLTSKGFVNEANSLNKYEAMLF
jgi:hypothetical protein